MQVIDFFIIIFISIIISLAVGIPLGMLVIKSDDFLSFNSDKIQNIIFNPTNLIYTLFWAALIGGLFVHVSRMLKLSRITIAETETDAEKTDPYWKKHNLDIIFFISGLVGFLVFYQAIVQQWFFLGPFLILGLPTPFLLIIGSIMLASRIFPSVMSKIGTKIWASTGGLIAFSFKNVIRHRQASTRAVMLIAVLLAILITFLSLPFSLNAWNYNQQVYQTGAEGVASLSATNGYFFNQTLLNIIEHNFSDYIESVSPFTRLNTYSNYGSGNILIINSSTYLQSTISTVNRGNRFSLQTDMNTLSSNTSNVNLLMQKKSANFRDLNIGDLYYYTTSLVGESITFKISDTFESWPAFYSYYYDEGQNLFGVTSYSQFFKDNISLEDSSLNVQQSGFYLNFKDGINQTYISSILQDNFSLSVTLLQDKIDAYKNSWGYLVGIGEININVLISIFIAIAILLMFAWLQLIERKKEIYTERALGMKLYQLFVLFLFESMILLFSGIILGAIMGFGLTEMFSMFITLGPTVPPYITLYPISLIMFSFSIILFLAFIGSLIPAYIVTRQDISSAFIGE
ncbi:MAG: ABC transporter permease [Candidatus Thorarchaeota archaeon]